MANLPPKRTGLSYQVWYSAKVPKHKPRIKVDLGDSHLSIEIETLKVKGDISKIKSSDLNLILKWVILNKDILLDYWNNTRNGTIDNVDVVNSLKKV